MLKKMLELGVSVVAIGMSTLLLTVLVLFPFSPVRVGLVCQQFWRNRNKVIEFSRVYSHEMMHSTSPMWILILGMPFVATIALLEDYVE